MKICFITTGDIKSIATSKRALGLANPLCDLGWDVSIIMEDTKENHHRTDMECNEKIKVYYFPHCSMIEERKYKNKFIQEINPDFLYICAFVTRNIVGIFHNSKKLVEHSELQTGIPDMKGLHRLFCYLYEYYSIIYSNALLNASMYLQKVFMHRATKILRLKKPMLYYPYAFNPEITKKIDIDYTLPKFKRFEGKINFVFLGTVTRNYGIFTILEAVKELQKTEKRFQMLILGRGRHYDEAKTFIKDNKLEQFVFMPGFVEEEEISEYFSLATAFVSPMNNTVQDWARCPSKMYLYLPYQKPIITCKIGEPYEVLKDEGYYYSSGNSNSMCKQMKKIIEEQITYINIDPNNYSWKKRAEELNLWIKELY